MYRYNPLDGDRAKIVYDKAYYRGQRDKRMGKPPEKIENHFDKIQRYKHQAYVDGYNGDFFTTSRNEFKENEKRIERQQREGKFYPEQFE